MMKTEQLFGVNANCLNRKCNKDSINVVGNAVDKNCNLDDDMHELYGGSLYGLPSSRPTMISAKYRQKEERRKLLKLSMNKLKRIEDPESSLRRSVLINNTVKRLQREVKEEKLQKSQIIASSPIKCFGISNDFIVRQEENNMKSDVFSPSLVCRTSDQLLDITNLPDSKNCSKYNTDCLDCDVTIPELTFHGERISKSTCKRSIDEALEDECDVLGQFYLPPTPCLGAALDEEEDEDVNVVDIDTSPPVSPPKKKRNCEPHNLLITSTSCLTAADRLRDNLSSLSGLPLSSSSPSSSLPLSLPTTPPGTSTLTSFSTSPLSSSPSSLSWSSSRSSSAVSPSSPFSNFLDWSADESILLQANAQNTMLVPPTSTSLSSSFSCGHSSMLNEIVVYHNLIASLES